METTGYLTLILKEITAQKQLTKRIQFLNLKSSFPADNKKVNLQILEKIQPQMISMHCESLYILKLPLILLTTYNITIDWKYDNYGNF